MAQPSVRIRGRRTRDRRIAAEVEELHQAASATTPRSRTPDLSALARLLATSAELKALVDRYRTVREGRIGPNLRHVTYAAMPHGAKSYLAAALVLASDERLVWIARDAEIADRVAEELQAWLGGPDAVVTLEPRTALAYERSELIRDESAARVAALAAWRTRSARVLVASVQALFQHTLAPSEIPELPVELKTGQRISQERVLRELIDLGYEALPEVAGRGEFARRGGIVDVFPAGQPLPVRIEWFGDQIESIRAFDPANQRGIRPVDAIRLLPASEFLLDEGSGGRLRDALGTVVSRLPADLSADLARLEQGQLADAAEIWAGHLAAATGLDHIAGEIVLIDEPADVEAAADFLWSQQDERRAELELAGILPKSWPTAYVGRREWKSALVAARTLELTWESDVPQAPPGGNPFGWHEPVLPPTPISDLAETVKRWRREGLALSLRRINQRGCRRS